MKKDSAYLQILRKLNCTAAKHPVTGMTNMSSNIAHAIHVKYLKYASQSNFIAAGIAEILFLIAGLFYHQ